MKRFICLLAALCMAFGASAKDDKAKQTVVFNVMTTKDSKQALKKISEKEGVVAVHFDAATSSVEVVYKPAETNIKEISDAFRINGVVAFPIGENCSVKKGGCLNNSATQINTMK